MSYQAWQSEYGGDPALVGSTLYLQGQPVTVVGVAPPGFFGDRINSNPPAFWIPLAIEPVIEGRMRSYGSGQQLAVPGRATQAGIGVGPLQAKLSNSLRVWLANAKDIPGMAVQR